jgi:hypothetical protein
MLSIRAVRPSCLLVYKGPPALGARAGRKSESKYHSPSLPSETETPLPLWLFHLPGTENLNVSVDVGGSGAVVGWVVGWKSRNSGPSSWQGKPRKGSLDVGVRDGRGARK